MQTRFFLQLLKIRNKKKLIRAVEEKGESSARESLMTINRLNNVISSMQIKIAELERKLAKSDNNKIELQRRIQNAFMKGLSTLNEETGEEPFYDEERVQDSQVSIGRNMVGSTKQLSRDHNIPPTIQDFKNSSKYNYTNFSKPMLESKDHLWEKVPSITTNKNGKGKMGGTNKYKR